MKIARPELPQVKRVFGTALAVAAVVGFVWVLRTGVSALVEDWSVGSSSSADRKPNVPEPMPRTYDLATIVPPALHTLVGGLSTERRVTHHTVPYAQVRTVCDNEARVAGWKGLVEAHPELARLRLGREYDNYYLTLDGKLVYRSFTQEEGGTRQEDFVFDIRPVSESKELIDFDKILAKNGERTREQLPPVLREVVPSGILVTHLIRRAGGASLTVMALSPFDATVAKAQTCGVLMKAGWERVEKAECGWTKANLFASYGFSPREDGKGTQIFVRISDDERLEVANNQMAENASGYRRRNERAAEPKTPTPANTRTAYFGSAAPCVSDWGRGDRNVAPTVGLIRNFQRKVRENSNTPSAVFRGCRRLEFSRHLIAGAGAPCVLRFYNAQQKENT